MIMLRFLLWIFGFWKGGDMHMPMVTVTVALIIAGRRKFSDVPANIRDEVRADLLALGLDENGKPFPTEPAE
ncbi:CD1375 family protein [Paenibacillus sp. GYB004]|uniref:CD1375 family protein n=1 Tax=Paenibacillus sp. GYB004 TaxID=2994393 RepID=UPI002F963DC9